MDTFDSPSSELFGDDASAYESEIVYSDRLMDISQTAAEILQLEPEYASEFDSNLRLTIDGTNFGNLKLEEVLGRIIENPEIDNIVTNPEERRILQDTLQNIKNASPFSTKFFGVDESLQILKEALDLKKSEHLFKKLPSDFKFAVDLVNNGVPEEEILECFKNGILNTETTELEIFLNGLAESSASKYALLSRIRSELNDPRNSFITRSAATRFLLDDLSLKYKAENLDLENFLQFKELDQKNGKLRDARIPEYLSEILEPELHRKRINGFTRFINNCNSTFRNGITKIKDLLSSVRPGTNTFINEGYSPNQILINVGVNTKMLDGYTTKFQDSLDITNEIGTSARFIDVLEFYQSAKWMAAQINDAIGQEPSKSAAIFVPEDNIFRSNGYVTLAVCEILENEFGINKNQLKLFKKTGDISGIFNSIFILDDYVLAGEKLGQHVSDLARTRRKVQPLAMVRNNEAYAHIPNLRTRIKSDSKRLFTSVVTDCDYTFTLNPKVENLKSLLKKTNLHLESSDKNDIYTSPLLTDAVPEMMTKNHKRVYQQNNIINRVADFFRVRPRI